MAHLFLKPKASLWGPQGELHPNRLKVRGLAEANLRVHGEHFTQRQQARALVKHAGCDMLNTDAGSDMLCRGDVVPVVPEVGNWHDLSACAVLGILQGKDQPYAVALTGVQTVATLELEVLHM
jgi:hypothetical protein